MFCAQRQTCILDMLYVLSAMFSSINFVKIYSLYAWFYIALALTLLWKILRLRQTSKVYIQAIWHLKCLKLFYWKLYLFTDLDEQDEYDDHKQVVNDAHSSNYDVDDLQHTVPDVGKSVRQVVRFGQGCRDVVPSIARQRCVLHRCCSSSAAAVMAAEAFISAAATAVRGYSQGTDSHTGRPTC